ncbi:MAG TPA: hypothetical protein VMM35_01145, partial [Longimicrobiales bacterium]|nr:hypothetical protein [Longimicrobiales bacterium]
LERPPATLNGMGRIAQAVAHGCARIPRSIACVVQGTGERRDRTVGGRGCGRTKIDSARHVNLLGWMFCQTLGWTVVLILPLLPLQRLFHSRNGSCTARQ